jgi:AcrR family transcriptional regulator
LTAAFDEIYIHGYSAVSMDRIVERSGVTKGALYHHFDSKKALAQAVIGGTIRTMVVDSFLVPLEEASNPIDGIQACLRRQLECLTAEQISCGCPLNNLAQELSASDDDFRKQISDLCEQWRAALARALVEGQEAGQVRGDVEPADVATFLVAAVAGVAGFAKTTRDLDVARTSMRVLCTYLEDLRPVASL